MSLRRGYNITEIVLWYDYVDIFIRLGRDMHNAHYVCPEDLQQAHYEIIPRLRARQEREQEEHKRKKARRVKHDSKNSKLYSLGLHLH